MDPNRPSDCVSASAPGRYMSFFLRQPVTLVPGTRRVLANVKAAGPPSPDLIFRAC